MVVYPLTFKQKVINTVLLVLFQIVHLVGSVWLFSAIWIKPSASRCRKIALSYDQLGNATMGGDEDETMSSMLGRTGKPVWLVKVVNWIFFELYGEVNHCQSKIEERFK
jgi:hypothetical protein